LDSDFRKGPQGYTYTVARTPEKMELGIRLVQSSDSRPDIANNEDISDDLLPSNSGRLSQYGPSDSNGRNSHRPINSVEFESFTITGRPDEREIEKASAICKECGRPYVPLGDDDRMCALCGADAAVFGTA
jgi:hypothetical protein